MSISYTSLAHPGDYLLSSFSSDKTQINLLFKKELRTFGSHPSRQARKQKTKAKKRNTRTPPTNPTSAFSKYVARAVRLPSQGFTFQGERTNDSYNTPLALFSSSIFLSSICPTHLSWRLPSQLPMSSLAMVWVHSPTVAPWTRIYTLTILTQPRPRTRCLTNRLPQRLRIALALRL